MVGGWNGRRSVLIRLLGWGWARYKIRGLGRDTRRDVEERGQETASPPVAPQLEGQDEEGEHAGYLRPF